MSPTDVERESCADCPDPNDGNDDWCTGGNTCRLKSFFTGINFDGLHSRKFCVSSKFAFLIKIGSLLAGVTLN